MFKKWKKAFTLIELVIVMSILFVLLIFSYWSYSNYQVRAKLKLATREVSQSFYEAKNMAISWVESEVEPWKFKNNSVIIVLSKDESDNNKIKYYFENFENYLDSDWNFNDSNILNILSKQAEKEKSLQSYINFMQFWWDDKYDKLILFYESVTWEVRAFLIDSSLNKIPVSSISVKIKLSFKDSKINFFQRDITYFLKTNIVDYK